MLLQIKNLQTYFHSKEGIVKAVDGIDFYLNKGETIGIVGESGSGKSVSALSIMRLVGAPGKIENGCIEYWENDEESVDLLKISSEEIRKIRGKEIAMIFQEPMTSLNPVFKCGKQITEALQLHLNLNSKEAKSKTLDLFQKVKLPDPERIFNAYPHQLSGGQKQRVMIAMALSCNPSILIADEPTTALDVTVQKAILELLNELKTEFQTSILFISHDLGVIAEIADRVLVMLKGKIIEQGTLEEIFKNPKHPYTKSLLACRPPLKFKTKRLPVASDFLEISNSDAGTLEIKEKEKSLDDVYTNLIISKESQIARNEELQAKEAFIEVCNLQTWFPGKSNFFGKSIDYIKAVNDVSFKVYPGETLGLVGESGCGKTTLGRSILKLQAAKSGQVFYKNEELTNLSANQMRPFRKDLQIIFQDPYSSLNPRTMVGSAILEPMLYHGLVKNKQEGREKVLELLATVGLEADHFYRYPHEFSGGQRQRICIARALAVEPKFIICDECVSSLDVSIQAQILNLLLDLREQFQLTYIFISHDLSVVKFMSDRMLVMNNGKIEEIGTSEKIYEAPESDYTKSLIAAVPKGLF